eukprot:scaffold62175_cov17-Tisochrysis_lutea.AAC.1
MEGHAFRRMAGGTLDPVSYPAYLHLLCAAKDHSLFALMTCTGGHIPAEEAEEPWGAQEDQDRA